MDPIAHTLFGATMAEAGLKRKTALATTTLIIGANIPDVDAVAMLISSDYALYVRRGWTHGIVALMVWPFIILGLMMGLEKLLKRFGRLREGPPMNKAWLLGLAFLGVWSHPFLDWLNTYGVRLLMPFNESWFYGDTLFIIDPWFWLLTGAAVVLARSKNWKGITGWIVLGTALTALVTTADIPTVPKVIWSAGIIAIVIARWTGIFRDRLQTVAITLFAGAILYTGFMITGSGLTASHARAALEAEGSEIHEVMPNPVPARPHLRTGIAASDTHYYRFAINWLRPDSFERLDDPIEIQEPDAIQQAAFDTPDLKGLRNWIRFPYYETQDLDEGWRVIIRDLRYVHPRQTTSEGIGMAVVDLDEELNVVRVR